MGYTDDRKGYRLYDEEHCKIVYSRDVIFNESVNGSVKQSEAQSNPTRYVKIDCFNEDDDLKDNDIRDEPSDIASDHDEEPVPQRSTREGHHPDHYGVWVNAADVTEPVTVEDALNGQDSDKWKDAMQADYESLTSNVWELVEPPKDCKLVSSKWIFKHKVGSTGLVERYKARLVAQGYSQRPGVDYDKMFSPVVRSESIRAVIALAAQNNLKLHQMDVTTAFLNGELKEVVYMKQPDGYIKKGKERLVCKLKRSIYGLKQSPCCWNSTLDFQLKVMGFYADNK